MDFAGAKNGEESKNPKQSAFFPVFTLLAVELSKCNINTEPGGAKRPHSPYQYVCCLPFQLKNVCLELGNMSIYLTDLTLRVSKYKVRVGVVNDRVCNRVMWDVHGMILDSLG